MEKGFVPFDWKKAGSAEWLDPCEESYYYAEKWKREGRKSVLDLGCGLGRHSVLFAQRGFKVTALDISDDALTFLKKYSKEMGVDIACRRADSTTEQFGKQGLYIGTIYILAVFPFCFGEWILRESPVILVRRMLTKNNVEYKFSDSINISRWSYL